MDKQKPIAVYSSDGLSSLLIVKRILESVGYEVIEVLPWWVSKEEIIQKAIELIPNIIVIDFATNESLEACQKLKDDHRTKDIPIVFVTWTQKFQKVSSEEAMSKGVDFLYDNQDIEDFVTYVESYLPH